MFEGYNCQCFHQQDVKPVGVREDAVRTKQVWSDVKVQSRVWEIIGQEDVHF